jgi:S-adenosylmethionine:tRNA ribosyltransferase-isomerase
VKRGDLIFDRPKELAATAPADARGLERDEVRLLVSTPEGHTHDHFYNLPYYLQPGDVLVVNHSATMPASLPASGAPGAFIVNLSTHFGNDLWLAEPRWSASQPGPLPLKPSERLTIAGLDARYVAPYPRLPDLAFIVIHGDIRAAMTRFGQPIRYGYIEQPYPLEHYQTVFASVPGSAEMPSAAYPFTAQVVAGLEKRGVELAGIVLHTGVSSLEVEADVVEAHPLYPEPFCVPAETGEVVNRARRDGRRVIAVGTTVIRALESAWDGQAVRPAAGYTRVYIHPRRGVHTVDGLITGLHDPVTSHLAMLYALAGQSLIRSAYAEAIRAGYLWHEFGDSHLILARPAVTVSKPHRLASVA